MLARQPRGQPPQHRIAAQFLVGQHDPHDGLGLVILFGGPAIVHRRQSSRQQVRRAGQLLQHSSQQLVGQHLIARLPALPDQQDGIVLLLVSEQALPRLLHERRPFVTILVAAHQGAAEAAVDGRRPAFLDGVGVHFLEHLPCLGAVAGIEQPAGVLVAGHIGGGNLDSICCCARRSCA